VTGPDGEGGAASARGSVEVVEPSAAQQAFARRVAESKATAPHVYFDLAHQPAPGVAALVAASASALRAVPLLNGAYRDGRFELYSRVNVAVGVEAPGMLLLPVIQDADTKDVDAIAAEVGDLGERARTGSLTAPAFAGATFTVIDLSATGVDRFSPVIARGQAATLGAGRAVLTLVCDNRIVQGGEGAIFLAKLAAALPDAKP
jgi:pyruvate dehydrogenase E2 component (dihydrolipoyllysine-residue acetyltransferase)